jgi:hypothetical protein
MPPGPLEGLRPRDLTEEQRQAALVDPGPTWREYFYYSFVKVWVCLGFFVLDAVLVASLLNPLQLVALVLAVPLAIYAEYVLYMYLWYRPSLAHALSRREEFRPSWRLPVEFGRWTPESDRIRRGLDPFLRRAPSPAGPDSREFL